MGNTSTVPEDALFSGFACDDPCSNVQIVGKSNAKPPENNLRCLPNIFLDIYVLCLFKLSTLPGKSLVDSQ